MIKKSKFIKRSSVALGVLGILLTTTVVPLSHHAFADITDQPTAIGAQTPLGSPSRFRVPNIVVPQITTVTKFGLPVVSGTAAPGKSVEVWTNTLDLELSS